MVKPSIVDSHCHLDFPDFEGKLDEVIGRAIAAGVTRMVSIATTLEAEPNVRAIAAKYEPVFYAAGIHPMNVANTDQATVDDLLKLTEHPKMVGIGETGLDYHYTSETADLQKQSLAIHIEAARRSGLPLIIHARAADDDMADILTQEYKSGAYNCVMHCFSSSASLAKAALDLDFYLSMSGIATFKKSDELRDIFAKAPIDRILTETDAPYLAPHPFRGKPNEPAYTALTAQVGAEIFDVSYEEFAKQTSNNFDRLFSKAAEWKATNG